MILAVPTIESSAPAVKLADAEKHITYSPLFILSNTEINSTQE